ncbi:hypothetical protein ABT084_30005, partial [Streptomyces sp. NPDC002138]
MNATTGNARRGRRWNGRAGREVAERLARGAALTEVLDPADPAAWIALDLGVREVPLWDEVLAGLLRAQPETALCHPAGRIREDALRGAGRSRALLPLVAIRCADWIEPVRTRARVILAGALAEDPAGTLRALTPLVLRLGARGRGAWARELFEAALRGAGGALLEELAADSDPGTRRYAGRLLLETTRPGAVALARRAAAEADPVLRRLWTDAALAALAASAPGPVARDGPVDGDGPAAGDGAAARDDARTVVDLLLGARSGQVRAAGVTALRRTGRAAGAVEHLADRVGVVRACARWLVGQDGGAAPAPSHHRPRARAEASAVAGKVHRVAASGG